MTIREQLVALSEECEDLCRCSGFVGSQTLAPNFRLIYTSVNTYEHCNRFVIIGRNPGGDLTDADTDCPNRPFLEAEYSAYLDDNWRGAGTGQDNFQRAVQGIAMVMTGATPGEAITSINSSGLTPVSRIGPEAVDFLRRTPSLNIIPFRHSRLNEVPSQLRDRGQQIGWELLCLMKPRPDYIITLTNGATDPVWRTILNNSGQSRSAIYERQIHPSMNRTYRELRLEHGPLTETMLIGLPAVVHDKGREDVTLPLFEVLSERLEHHGIVASIMSP